MEQAVVQSSLSVIDIFSIIASVFSIVLGIVAIYLSIVFYKMSDKASKESEKSAANIEASVKKLETVFEKLYSGTFDMMKETVTDMRKHAYRVDSTQEEVSQKLNKELKEKTLMEVAATVAQIKSSQKSDEELQKIIIETINNSKKSEVDLKRDILREEIINFLKINKCATYSDIEEHFMHKGIGDANGFNIFRELRKMAEEHIINNPFRYDSDLKDVSINIEEIIFLL